ncbi:MAG TPA: phospho-sugar mutase [Clostridia bacterium]|nr:phospho-sugar mutase [Clostridia bacterium]
MTAIDYMHEYMKWLESSIISSRLRFELDDIKGNDDEIRSRFMKRLTFGTGGMRGLTGAGTNRINEFTIMNAAVGLADLLNDDFHDNKSKSVVIAYDSRHKSQDYAKRAAMALASKGIKVCFFREMRPTPMLSFAVRYLGCDAGIVITASHNPARYNGFKVYDSRGVQILPDTAERIAEKAMGNEILKDIPDLDFDDACESGLLEILEKDFDENYIRELGKIPFGKTFGEYSPSVVYSPLFGTGAVIMPGIFKSMGIENITYVSSQMKGDGSFPGLFAPNPENSEVYEQATTEAIRTNAELIVITDPDGDRLGLSVRKARGQYQILTGNQIGYILLRYISETVVPATQNPCIIKTWVTSDLADRIARANGIRIHETPAGFKFIGSMAEDIISKGKETFLMGMEESNGYLFGPARGDKDAFASALMAAGAVSYYGLKGKTLLDVLDEIHGEYGHCIDRLESFSFDGDGEKNEIAEILRLLENPSFVKSSIRGSRLLYIPGRGIRTDLGTMEETVLQCSGFNMIKIILDRDSWIAVRSSGTEPKLKVYYNIFGSDRMEATQVLENAVNDIQGIISNFRKIESI